jgi:uncharacterized protein YcnI
MIRRAIPIAGGVLAAMVTGAALLFGHAVVWPRTSTPGAYEKYSLRVPNERPVGTREVTLTFPANLRVVSFGDVPGWTLTVERDTSNRIATATWKGELGVERFVEFPFVAVNPREAGTLVWNASQLYVNGELVNWTGPESSRTPASITEIRAVASGSDGSRTPLLLSAGALVLAIIALTFSLRRRSA